jgi:hypothetical protein
MTVSSLSSYPGPRPVASRKSYLASLAILIPCNTATTSRAAGHLVAAQVVRDNPLPILDAMGEAL